MPKLELFTVGVEYVLPKYGYITVRAKDAESACKKAIRNANEDPDRWGKGSDFPDVVDWTGWSSCWDACGPTFVTDIVRDTRPVVRGGDPSKSEPVPVAYREDGPWLQLVKAFPGLLDKSIGVDESKLTEFVIAEVQKWAK